MSWYLVKWWVCQQEYRFSFSWSRVRTRILHFNKLPCDMLNFWVTCVKLNRNIEWQLGRRKLMIEDIPSIISKQYATPNQTHLNISLIIYSTLSNQRDWGMFEGTWHGGTPSVTLIFFFFFCYFDFNRDDLQGVRGSWVRRGMMTEDSVISASHTTSLDQLSPCRMGLQVKAEEPFSCETMQEIRV